MFVVGSIDRYKFGVRLILSLPAMYSSSLLRFFISSGVPLSFAWLAWVMMMIRWISSDYYAPRFPAHRQSVPVSTIFPSPFNISSHFKTTSIVGANRHLVVDKSISFHVLSLSLPGLNNCHLFPVSCNCEWKSNVLLCGGSPVMCKVPRVLNKFNYCATNEKAF